MVKNAVNEMRRYYSRKVVDVLIKVTRRTLDLIIKPFSAEALVSTESKYFISDRNDNVDKQYILYYKRQNGIISYAILLT